MRKPAFLKKIRPPFPLTPLSIAFMRYILVLFINGVVLDNVYHGELYLIFFFILPFIVFFTS